MSDDTIEEFTQAVQSLTVNTDINVAVPADCPCMWVSRDKFMVEGTSMPSDVIDVWASAPQRECQPDGTVVYVDCRDDSDSAECDQLLGRFTVAEVRERFGTVPDADECIYFDNPKVN